MSSGESSGSSGGSSGETAVSVESETSCKYLSRSIEGAIERMVL